MTRRNERGRTLEGRLRQGVVGVLLGWGVATAAPAAELADPYELTVWSRVLFTEQGLPRQIEVQDEGHPEQFLRNVEQRLASLKIDPPQRDGIPQTLRTGVWMRLAVQPQTGAGALVTVVGRGMAPLPLKRYFASAPRDVSGTGGWEGEVEGVCHVGPAGRCVAIEVNALPGLPESVRRFMRVSLEGWQFEPPQIGGSPVEASYRLALRLNTMDSVPEDFREDKFWRLQRQR